ncbi:DUF554 domain-containing protein [Lachnospiraceae bacterium OttesenSCG-928-E19]|nr:DUF554 domain-containing protein [Lachnospiraceae bacterium OttesenSCG-928-E19]
MGNVEGNEMIGMGTLVNVVAVIAGGAAGLVLKRGMKQRFQDIITQAIGLAVIFIGVSGGLSQLLVLVDGKFETQKSMMLIISMVLGALIGEAIDIDGHTEHFGAWLKHKAKSDGDSLFIEGFVITSLTTCVGAMAVVGAINDGLTGDASMLYMKSILDFVISIIFASTYGIGVLFSVIPIVIFQGSITLLATLIAPYLTQGVIDNMSAVGGVLIFVVGINLVFKAKIKVANLLPALIIAVAYAYIM